MLNVQVGLLPIAIRFFKVRRIFSQMRMRELKDLKVDIQSREAKKSESTFLRVNRIFWLNYKYLWIRALRPLTAPGLF